MKYFISYLYKTHNGFGFGNCEFETESEILSLEDVRVIEEQLEMNFGYKETKIMGYSKLPSTK